jgi:putative methyltransferase (TIGR04325 family)
LSLRALAKEWLPPVVQESLRRRLDTRRAPEWEYCPDGWATRDERINGWNVASVLEAQRRTWPEFVRMVESSGPLGINHPDPVPNNINLAAHHTVMSFGYVAALAAHGRDTLSFLDWGGGIGHYAVFARALLPGVQVEYFCKEVPLLCQGGREVLPGDTFLETEAECLSRRYDLVMASGSLQYSPDWQRVLALLAEVTGEYLFVTRHPVVHTSPSFVVVQRPYGVAYDTEYIGWFLNRGEFLTEATALGMQLQREFLVHPSDPIRSAPEQGEYRGYLFRRKESIASATRETGGRAGT